MYRHPLKPVLIGAAVGFTLFILPFFLLKAMLFMLIIGGMFKLFGNRRFHWRHRHGLHPSFADTIRHMDEATYKAFRESLSGDYHYRKEIPITDSN